MNNIDWSKVITAEQKQIEARERLKQAFQTAIQSHVDAVAQSRGYDNGVSLASYATDAEPNATWRNEGRDFVRWRSHVWSVVNDALSAYEAGERDAPTVEEFMAELPSIEWSE